jgi:RNA-directed DNA polymerase
MGDTRPNHQLLLAFMVEARSEAPTARPEGTESPIAAHEAERPASNVALMEEICRRTNLEEALRRVQINKGSPGIDGMTVDELVNYLRQHWPTIREQLLNGTYRPQPVKRVEIPLH